MGRPGWVTPEHAKEFDMVRAHNGIGWFWCHKDHFEGYAEDTAKAIAAGEVAPEYWKTYREDED